MILTKNGVHGLHPHMFRHSCATHLLMRVGPYTTFGHQSLSTTQRYTHKHKRSDKEYRKSHPRAQGDSKSQ